MTIAVAATALAVGSSVASFAGQINAANQAAEAREAQIREEQVGLRLQQTQRSIDRLNKVRQTLASATVQSGVRGIDPSSASLRAITEDTLQNYQNDEEMDRLNFGQKKVATDWSLANSETRRNATYFSATSQLGMNLARTGFSYAQIPNQSLLDASASGSSNQFNPNR